MAKGSVQPRRVRAVSRAAEMCASNVARGYGEKLRLEHLFPPAVRRPDVAVSMGGELGLSCRESIERSDGPRSGYMRSAHRAHGRRPGRESAPAWSGSRGLTAANVDCLLSINLCLLSINLRNDLHEGIVLRLRAVAS